MYLENKWNFAFSFFPAKKISDYFYRVLFTVVENIFQENYYNKYQFLEKTHREIYIIKNVLKFFQGFFKKIGIPYYSYPLDHIHIVKEGFIATLKPYFDAPAFYAYGHMVIERSRIDCFLAALFHELFHVYGFERLIMKGSERNVNSLQIYKLQQGFQVYNFINNTEEFSCFNEAVTDLLAVSLMLNFAEEERALTTKEKYLLKKLSYPDSTVLVLQLLEIISERNSCPVSRLSDFLVRAFIQGKQTRFFSLFKKEEVEILRKMRIKECTQKVSKKLGIVLKEP